MERYAKLAPARPWMHGPPHAESQLRVLYRESYLTDPIDVLRPGQVQDSRRATTAVDLPVGRWMGHVVRNPNQRTNFIAGLGNAGDTMTSSSQWVILVEHGADVREGDTLIVNQRGEDGVLTGKRVRYEASYVDDDSSFLPAIMVRASYLGVDQDE